MWILSEYEVFMGTPLVSMWLRVLTEQVRSTASKEADIMGGRHPWQEGFGRGPVGCLNDGIPFLLLMHHSSLLIQIIFARYGISQWRFSLALRSQKVKYLTIFRKTHMLVLLFNVLAVSSLDSPEHITITNLDDRLAARSAPTLEYS